MDYTTGKPRFDLPFRVTGFFLRSIQIVSEVHPTTYLMAGGKATGCVKLTTYFKLMLSLNM
jgi:hypothetical protein